MNYVYEALGRAVIGDTKMPKDPYHLAQSAMADLKAAVHLILARTPNGMTNAQIGRTLGIYGGHVGHEGHISRTLLAVLEIEGVAEQDPGSKKWSLKDHAKED
jgi:hypothetical protein